MIGQDFLRLELRSHSEGMRNLIHALLRPHAFFKILNPLGYLPGLRNIARIGDIFGDMS